MGDVWLSGGVLKHILLIRSPKLRQLKECYNIISLSFSLKLTSLNVQVYYLGPILAVFSGSVTTTEATGLLRINQEKRPP